MELRENNLFRYATSELSQDAFICWLLSHLKEEVYDVDKYMTACANDFMAEIFKNTIVWTKDKRVKSIKRQYKKIDILVEVDDYKIIIEDKTFTSTHDNQINRYKQILIDEGVDAEKIICVYYKIIEQPNKEEVDCEFDRIKLLNIFREYYYYSETLNQIFIDYVEYLDYIHELVNSYVIYRRNTTPFVLVRDWGEQNLNANRYDRGEIIEKLEKIEKWSNCSEIEAFKYLPYIGFFSHLTSGMLKDDATSWSYIANPQGGYMALWIYDIFSGEELEQLGFEKECIENLYLQLEKRDDKDIISVKYSISNAKAKKEVLKDKVLNYKVKIAEYFSIQLGSEFIKSVNKYANSMTVGYIHYDETNYKDKINLMKDTLKNIKLDLE